MHKSEDPAPSSLTELHNMLTSPSSGYTREKQKRQRTTEVAYAQRAAGLGVRGKARATQASENSGINLVSLWVLEVYRKGANVTASAYSPWTKAVWTGSRRAEHWPASILEVSKEQRTGQCKSMSSLGPTPGEADTSTQYTCSLLSERICKAKPNPAGTLTSVVAWVMQGPTALQ